MAVIIFNTISNTTLAYKKPVTFTTMRQLRDNVLATAQGYSTAPRIAHQALSYQDFTSSGTFVVPDYVTAVYVEVIAGGGGGGPGVTTNGHSGGGAGGQAAGWVSVSAGANITVTVGTGGTGATASNDDATAGGSSSFGTSVVATGGTRGRQVALLSSIDTLYAAIVAARGGVGTAGQFVFQGSAGMLNNNNTNGVGSAEGGRGIGGIGGNIAGAHGTFYGEGGRSGAYGNAVAGYNGKSGLVRVWY